MSDRLFPVRQLASPLTPRGFVVFVNVRPDRAHGCWICDECGERVRPSRFGSHTAFHR